MYNFCFYDSVLLIAYIAIPHKIIIIIIVVYSRL